ncbi:MAG: hypothetical protein KatS3mg020_0656 [Fimbriimonadales bacterium]|nr:MAG: hypothetical protein KatS3mg020_0656 [Fimbriimonadales bacterium]
METQTGTGDWRIQTQGTAILHSRFRTLVRPATPFELMDDAVSYYRENFRSLFRISLWIYIVPTIVSILLIGPMLLLDATTQSGMIGSILLEYGGLFIQLPFLTLAPMLQSAFTTLAFRMLATGEPITLPSLWSKLKPRFWRLMANQMLAGLVLSGIFIAIGLGYMLLVLGVILGVASLIAGSPTLSIVLVSTLLIVVSVVALVIAAMATVWFMFLPPIIVLEERTGPIKAFSRAFELVRPNFKHAVVSYLVFLGIQAVFILSVMLLSIIILGVIVGIASIYADWRQLLPRWLFSLNQIYESVSYITYMFVMPPMYLMSVLLYFDLRYRSEGLDIYEVLQQSAQG